jgi:citrate lyase subunit beta/citryl-CoA lyase
MLQAQRGRQQRWVRVNALDTGLTLADLAAVMPARPDGIVLPKCAEAGQVRQLGHWLDAFEAAHGLAAGSTRILAIATETAGSLFGLGSYGQAGPRLAALTWGAEDLSADIGGLANRAEGAWLGVYRLAREMCLAGAAAAGVPALDTVQVEINDLDGQAAHARTARRGRPPSSRHCRRHPAGSPPRMPGRNVTHRPAPGAARSGRCCRHRRPAR